MMLQNRLEQTQRKKQHLERSLEIGMSPESTRTAASSTKTPAKLSYQAKCMLLARSEDRSRWRWAEIRRGDVKDAPQATSGFQGAEMKQLRVLLLTQKWLRF